MAKACDNLPNKVRAFYLFSLGATVGAGAGCFLCLCGGGGRGGCLLSIAGTLSKVLRRVHHTNIHCGVSGVWISSC
jgi:hypothetical protein